MKACDKKLPFSFCVLHSPPGTVYSGLDLELWGSFTPNCVTLHNVFKFHFIQLNLMTFHL